MSGRGEIATSGLLESDGHPLSHHASRMFLGKDFRALDGPVVALID